MMISSIECKQNIIDEEKMHFCCACCFYFVIEVVTLSRTWWTLDPNLTHRLDSIIPLFFCRQIFLLSMYVLNKIIMFSRPILLPVRTRRFNPAQPGLFIIPSIWNISY
jgi:hypothetical protein